MQWLEGDDLRHRSMMSSRVSLGWASVLSSDVNRPSWRLHTQRLAVPADYNWTTKHPALIPHEVPAGARRSTAIPARRGAKRPARAGNPPARPACPPEVAGFESRRSRLSRCTTTVRPWRARRPRLALAADAVVIAVEAMRVRVRHVPQHAEAAVGNVRAVEVRRRRWEALVRIRGRAPASRRRRRRWRRRRRCAEALEAEHRMELDGVRGDADLAVV